MVLGRINTRFTRNLFTQWRSSVLHIGRIEIKDLPPLKNYILQPRLYSSKVVPRSISFLPHSVLNSTFGQWSGFSSSSSPKADEKEAAQSANELDKKGVSEAAVDAHQQTEASDTEGGTESDLEIELSKDDLVKLVREKEGLLLAKQGEVSVMKDKVLRTLAEMENMKQRASRESDNAKKFAIQNFAKGLLDVADNLGRAASAAKESFTKIETSNDSTGALKQLKTLLEGVEMTEKQLIEVFRKHGLEKYDPTDEDFDPNRHNAVFQVPTSSKGEGLVAVVLKAGYTLNDRVIRPAEVGVTVALDTESESGKEDKTNNGPAK